MKGLLGFKVGMTQIIEPNGDAVPVTIIQAGPCPVTQVKTIKTDGYNAVQLGFAETKDQRLTRGQLGHLGRVKAGKKNRPRKNVRNMPALKILREFRTKTAEDYQIGQVLTVEQFEIGSHVDVTGKSKGRGFQGGVKRHGFRGGPKTHGQSDRHRAPGSIGSTSHVGRVFKGTRMAGRMGNDRTTAQNLQVVRIDPEKNLIAVRGAVPGAKGGLVIIREAAKS
ncbi:MAG: 50S ribosomal protein L3 [Anaerolineales bacterium]|nr:50S ribosomal protein L3 [Anaerolineales bacterium]MCB8954216.1 50S ribosomal protein L3 [Ardenticatenales bacterium]